MMKKLLALLLATMLLLVSQTALADIYCVVPETGVGLDDMNRMIAEVQAGASALSLFQPSTAAQLRELMPGYVNEEKLVFADYILLQIAGYASENTTLLFGLPIKFGTKDLILGVVKTYGPVGENREYVVKCSANQYGEVCITFTPELIKAMASASKASQCSVSILAVKAE